MMRFGVCWSVALSCLVSAMVPVALAAPRPGAPRPLQSGSTLIRGVNARFADGSLTFARSENGASDWWSARPKRGEMATGKVLDWNLESRGAAFAASTISWANGVSPDRTRRAYASNYGGGEAIYLEPVASIDADRAQSIQRVATMARNPVWLDAKTLIYESTRPENKGLFRIAIPADGSTPGAPQLLFSRGGEAAISRDGKMICLAVVDEKTAASQLYLLAVDGSGARVLAQTQGARRPVFSPDDKAIFFDAPAPMSEGAAASTPARERVLWTLPLVASPPTAQLFAAREAKNGDVEIVGTLFSSETGTLQARLEFSPGEMENAELENADRVWFACPLNRAPIHNGVLGAWPLPRKSNGQTQAWTMRISATDDSGERAESTLTFMWPPENNKFAMPPLFPSPMEDFGLTEKTPIAQPEIPEIIEPQKPEVRAPVSSAPIKVTPKETPRETPPATPKQLPSLPSPALPFDTEIEEFDPNEISPFPLPVRSTPAPPLARRVESPAPVVQVSSRKTANKPKNNKPKAKPAPTASGGIPSQMKSGASVPVTVVLKNTGSRSWSSTGPSPVRLIYRWVNAETNIRQRWAVNWLREEVPPGKSTQVKFDLIAPPATGRFVLTYALVRLNSQNYDGKNYKPPSTKATDHRWPGEFGAVSFNITVTP